MAGTARSSRFDFKIDGIDDDLPVAEFGAREGLSVPYEVDLKLAADDDIDLTKALGSGGCLKIGWEDGDEVRSPGISQEQVLGVK